MPLNNENEFVDDRPDVRFNKVATSEEEEDRHGEEYLSLKYKQPSISVLTEANFAQHEVFGDMTVRQKIGEKPDELTIEGQCTGDEATKVDKLTYEEVVELVSERWSGVIHVASTSTEPVGQGGGMDLDGEWVYRFTIEAVEITESMDASNDLSIEDLINSDGRDYVRDHISPVGRFR